MWRACVLAALASTACLRSVTYTCASDNECGAGKCEPDHLCAFVDSTCTNGYRYGELGGDGRCVGEGPDGGGGSYTIGGMVTGLVGTLVLQDNGGDDKVITADGPFMFATALAPGASYTATVSVQPSAQTCSIANAMGTIGGGPVVDVDVTCTSVNNGIVCGAATCTNGTMKCCHDDSDANGVCKTTGAGCGGGKVNQVCDDTSDCGGGTNLCCAILNGTKLSDVHCVTSMAACTGGSGHQFLCDPNATMPCPGALTCQPDAMWGWHHCQ